MSTSTFISNRTGRPITDPEEILGLYGPGEAVAYDDPEFGGGYGYIYRAGLASDHVEAFVAAGGTIRPAASGSGLHWAVIPSGRTVPVVCSEIIPIITEDGRSDGRCGDDATVDGLCAGHAADYRTGFHPPF